MRRRFINNSMPLNYSNYLTIEAIEDVSVLFNVEVQWTTNGRKWETSKRVIAKAGQLVSIKRNTTQGESLSAFWSEGAYNLRGNIMSLLFEDEAKGKTSMLGYSFQNLFRSSNVVTVEKGFLPATTLESNCYNSMFYGCTSLTTAPELPATTLVTNCYDRMFFGCSKLNYIKMLATDISATSCLRYWVLDVASTGTFVKNAAMTSLPTGYDGIPSGWTVQNA